MKSKVRPKNSFVNSTINCLLCAQVAFIVLAYTVEATKTEADDKTVGPHTTMSNWNQVLGQEAMFAQTSDDALS